MLELIMSLMLWISTQTGWAVPEPPKIEYIESPHKMFIIANGCDIKPEEPICKTYNSEVSEVLGLYNNITGTILLNKDFWQNGTKDQSVLLHELVHHMQYSRDREHYTKLCRGSIEKEAFGLQKKWLAERKLNLLDIVGIGPLYLHVLTQCDMF